MYLRDVEIIYHILILGHPDAPGVVMAYPAKIPFTKMKKDIMMVQLPNPIRFIIDYITPWAEGKITGPKSNELSMNTLLNGAETMVRRHLPVVFSGRSFQKLAWTEKDYEITGQEYISMSLIAIKL